MSKLTFSLIIGASGATGALALVVMLFGQHQRRAQDKKKVMRKKPSNKPAFHRDMQEQEYLPLIPRSELRAIKSFLATVMEARGWPLSSSQPHECSLMMAAAWKRAEKEAKCDGGGGWSDHFTLDDLHPTPLLLLAQTIDRIFLGGLQMMEGGSLCNLCLIVEEGDAKTTRDWISHFDENNVIHLLRPKWSQEVSEERPMVCEGEICTSRLQLLLRTVAHEMVHALVFNLWRSIDLSSPAYLPDERHGPIFKLLNKRLFGHTSDSYRYVFR